MVIFEEQLFVELPDSFHEMALERIKNIYPYDEKPQIIWEDKNTNRFCTFSLFKERGLTGAQTEYAIELIQKAVLSLYPSSLLDEAKLRDCKGGKCGWFSFKGIGDKGELFNLMYIFPVNGCMMFGTMGCGMGDEAGKEQLMDIMKSLQTVRKKFSYAVNR